LTCKSQSHPREEPEPSQGRARAIPGKGQSHPREEPEPSQRRARPNPGKSQTHPREVPEGRPQENGKEIV